MILPRVIKIWNIKNDNYRLVIKNHGSQYIYISIIILTIDENMFWKLIYINNICQINFTENVLKI